VTHVPATRARVRPRPRVRSFSASRAVLGAEGAERMLARCRDALS
jgi:hypothetical protein